MSTDAILREMCIEMAGLLARVLQRLEAGSDFQTGPKGRDADLIPKLRRAVQGWRPIDGDSAHDTELFNAAASSRTAVEKANVIGRFWLFCFDDYYPRGGMDDVHGQFVTLDAAVAALRDGHAEIFTANGGWHVLDVSEMRVVLSGRVEYSSAGECITHDVNRRGGI